MSPPFHSSIYLKKTSLIFLITVLVISGYLLLASRVFAVDMPNDKSQWHARLTPVALSFANRTTITGIGQAQAEIQGNKLIIRGDFSGLQGAATKAKIHQGPKAIPGPAIIELVVVKKGDGKQGTITGEVSLSQEQLSALQNQSLYLQLYSEVAKDGNLRGWLLPAKN